MPSTPNSQNASSPPSGPEWPRGVEGSGFHHRPVMLDEIVELLGTVPPGTIVDATLGGGGHAEGLLSAHPHLRVLGLDRDLDAISAASNRLASFGARIEVRHSRFDELATAVTESGHDVISGFLLDLGVSSPQLDRPERGFSYRAAGPLDMRMDPTSGRSADALVNELPEAELASILSRYGDERFATRIARAIVAARPVADTARLAEIVRDAIPAPARRTGGHPAKRSFQALRIAVNEELEQLPAALDQGLELLAPGGRGAVLTYHSGEDRVVKARFASACGLDRRVPRGLPVDPHPAAPFRLVFRGSRTPSAAELAANPRAESARLRVIERRLEAA